MTDQEFTDNVIKELRAAIHKAIAGLPKELDDLVRIRVALLENTVERRTRARVACDIEAVAFGAGIGVIPRPQVAPGEFLNDWQWAQHVARYGLPDGVSEVTPE